MVLIRELSFHSHFEITPCLFESITRQSCAFCNRASRSGLSTAGAQVTERVRLILPPLADDLPDLQ